MAAGRTEKGPRAHGSVIARRERTRNRRELRRGVPGEVSVARSARRKTGFEPATLSLGTRLQAYRLLPTVSVQVPLSRLGAVLPGDEDRRRSEQTETELRLFLLATR